MNTRRAISKRTLAILAMTCTCTAVPLSLTTTRILAATAIPAPKLTANQAEQEARQLFSIPTNDTLQNESYSDNVSSGTDPSYNLNFGPNTNNQTGDTFSVTIDAMDGSVMNYSHNQQNLTFEFPVPVSESQAATVAEAWAKKLYPSRMKEVTMQARPEQETDLRSPTTYDFTFERVVNGVPAPFDGFDITIDETGQLENVDESWTNVSFPDASAAVSQQQLNETYEKALGLHLEYDSVYQGNGTSNVALEYVTTPENGGWDQSYAVNSGGPTMAIDAQTGQLLASDGSPSKVASYAPPTPLGATTASAPLGTKAVDWSKQQALNSAETLFNLPQKDLSSENEWTGNGSDTTWNFQFVLPKSKTSSEMNVNVGVDATYGYISSYSQNATNPTSASSATPKSLPNATLEADAKKWMEKIFTNHLGEIALQNTQASPDNQPIQSFQVVSLVNGVPNQTANGDIDLDPTTGNLQYFNFNIQQTGSTFPSPSKAVSLATADSAYEKAYPLKLTYVLAQPNGASNATAQTPTVKLAYMPEPQSSDDDYFDATQGQFVQNVALAYQPYTGTIEDIASDPAEAQLQLLASRGLIPVDANGDVHPNSSMTVESFVKLVQDALGTVNRFEAATATSSPKIALAVSNITQTNPAYREMVTAYELGWLDPSQPVNPTATIDRNTAAQILIKALGYDALLTKPEMFKFNATDIDSIPTDDLAGDAMAVGLGLMSLSSGQFDGATPLTLSQAAQAVVQTATYMKYPQVILPILN